jgi:hypothetical protein
MAGVAEAPTEGNVYDVSEVELNFIVLQRVEEAIERLLF